MSTWVCHQPALSDIPVEGCRQTPGGLCGSSKRLELGVRRTRCIGKFTEASIVKGSETGVPTAPPDALQERRARFWIWFEQSQ